MMIVMVSLSYPEDIEKEVCDQIINLRQTPDFLAFKGPCISSKIGDSYRKMCIYELREEKLAAANKYFNEKFLSLSKFPGFVYDLKLLSKLDGALTQIGGL